MTATARTIRVVIDSSGARKGANETNAALRSIGSTSGQANKSLRDGSKALRDFERAANDNGKSAGRFGGVLDAIKSKVGSLRGLLDETSGAFGGAGEAAASGAGKVGVFTRAFGALGALGPAAIVLGIAAAFVDVGVAGLEAAAKVEQYKANLLTMTKDVKAADAAWAGLAAFANKTPFTLEQSVEGFTKLRALGLATGEAIMTSYGNTAAAMGKNMSQMIEAVADAVTGEFERLKEFGIKAKTEGNKVAFTFQGVTTTVGKNSKEIQDYLVKIGQTNFGGAMARQMDTLNGAFSNLEDKVFLFKAALGDGPFGAAVKDMVNTLADGIGAVTPLFSGLMDIFGGIVSYLWDVTKGVVSMVAGFHGGGTQIKGALDTIALACAWIGESIKVVGSIVGQVFGFIGTVVGTVVNGIGSMFSKLFDWMVPTFGSTGQSAGEALVGILRAGQFVANELPNVFKVALLEIKAMFMRTGAALGAALTGDFSKFEKINLSFSRTRKVAAAVWEGAGKVFNNRTANQKWMSDRLGTTEGNLNFDALGKEKPSADKGKKSADDAERKAKAQADFWKGLEQELELAKLTSAEAEKRRKEFEYEKIVGRDINAQERTRLETLIDQTKAAAFMTAALEDYRGKAIDLSNQEQLLKSKLAGATDEQLSIEKAWLDKLAETQKQNLKLDDAQLAVLKAKTEEEARRAWAIQNSNKLLEQGFDVAGRY